MTSVERLRAALAAEGGELAASLTDVDSAAPGPAADGSRVAGQEEAYELVIELIREGYLVHYGAGRVVRPEDPDLALLAGDRMYALGLARLAALGDLDAVIELADVISLSAQAHAAGDPELAEAAWAAGTAAVGRGGGAEHGSAKAAARAGDPGAAAALRQAAGT
jgi:hypothetical protein